MTAAILLAAGASRRMGAVKQLLDWRGRPLVAHALEQLMSAGCPRIVVVLGAHAAAVERACQSTVERHEAQHSIAFVRNKLWHLGQASSLNCGFRHLLQENLGSSLIISALCDQPYVLAEHYRRLIAPFADEPWLDVVATRYESGGGAPACFRTDVVHELSYGSGDTGAKSWIRNCAADRVRLIELPEAKFDLDTTQQYESNRRG
jgi:CTP:molybdopterin cytidylyltransferase MocA